MRLSDTFGALAEKVLTLGCWLAPGPRCPRVLAAALTLTIAAGLLGALFYLLVR